MIRRPHGRVPISAIVALVALVALVGAGFGLLGGRPQASPPSAAAFLAPSSVAVAPSGLGATPRRSPSVTPSTACGSLPPDGPPGVMLTVGDHLMAAQVELADDETARPGPHREPIDIPADATADIRIAAGACATGWHLAVWSPSDGQLYPLDIMPNPSGDPALALQNEFHLVFTPFRNQSVDQLELRGAFQFPGRDVLARWPIRVLPFERPQPRLLVREDRAIPMVEGCDIVLTFANSYAEPMTCDGDLSAEPAAATRLPPGTPMSLDFDGWSIGDTIAYCGASLDLAFVLMTAPGCEQHPPHGQSFTAPRAGDWTMAIGACAVSSGNRICGTWFVNVDTR